MISFILTNPSREKSSIALLVSFKAIKYKRPTGESCLVKDFIKKKSRVKLSLNNPMGVVTNNVLDRMEEVAIRTVAKYKEFLYPPSKDDFWKTFKSEYYKDADQERNEIERTKYLAEYLRQKLDKIRETKSNPVYRKFFTLLSKIEEFERTTNTRLLFSDINIEFYNDFKAFFFSKGYSANYFGTLIKAFKQIYNEAREEGCHDFKNVTHRGFISTTVETDSIYLTSDELNHINDLNFTQDLILQFFPEIDKEQVRKKIQSYNLIRDRFIIGAYTGLRVSDFARLGEINIGEDFIRMRAKKTGKEAVIPISSNIRKVLNRGFDPSVVISDQKINKNIKVIGRIAGITQDTLVHRNIGGKTVQETHQKCELITSHTARRSFATNAYKAKVPILSIMQITGHAKESEFLKYIRISREENAEILASHDFFK